MGRGERPPAEHTAKYNHSHNHFGLNTKGPGVETSGPLEIRSHWISAKLSLSEIVLFISTPFGILPAKLLEFGVLTTVSWTLAPEYNDRIQRNQKMRLGLFLSALLTVLLQTQLAYGQGEILTGEDIAKVLVGNTIQMNFRDSQSDFRTQTFHEYYDPDGSIYGMVNYREQAGNLKHFVGSWQVKDGKFCTSVYGRDYSCNQLKPIKGNNFELVGESGVVRDVIIYEGKHHGIE